MSAGALNRRVARIRPPLRSAVRRPRRVCDMLMQLESEVESLHASPAAFLRPQSSSLRDQQHPAGRDRARLSDSERSRRKFVATLADLRGELGFRIASFNPTNPGLDVWT